jgi:hypothetical protein
VEVRPEGPGRYRRSAMSQPPAAGPDPSPDDDSTPAEGAAADREGAADDRPGGAEPATVPLSDEQIRDALPDDLDAAGYVGPYLFPNNNRRRIPAYLYWVIAAVCIVLWAVNRDGENPLINGGFLAAGLGLALIGAYSFVTGWNLEVDERDALVVATRQVGFPVGHASAQMGWRGLLSRPTWRILLYSADEPPEKRGLVLVDGVNGDVVEWFVEENPEDWSDLSR